MSNASFQVAAASAVSAIEAGYGLLHADTIVATTNDELCLAPPGVLKINGRETRGKLGELGLKPGVYDAEINGRKARLILVEPGRTARKFGVRHGCLGYDAPVITGEHATASWDTLWKTGAYPDIVVDFEAPYKFVFWRGMSYAPSWALGNCMTSFFFAETLEPGVFRDCCEMMSDRECRYSHARVIQASAARIVVHWRCALADTDYNICRNQWADELFYIYPDGTAVRNATIHLDPGDEAVWQTCPRTLRRVPCSMIDRPPGKRAFNDMEFITVNPPGASSDAITPLEALTLLDADEFAETFRWPRPRSLAGAGLPKLREYIFRMNYKNRAGVFVASRPEGLRVQLQENTGMRYKPGARVADDRWETVKHLPVNFADHIHWPVTRGYGTAPLTDPAVCRDRPTHTFLGFANNAPGEVTERGDVTWTWFCGMAPENEGDLRARVRSWSRPATIRGASYLAREGAYRVDARGRESALEVESAEPVIRPAFLLPRMRLPGLVVLVNGQRADAGEVALGVEASLDSEQTVVTFRTDLSGGAVVQFEQVESPANAK
ncbi:MAG: hypothetical protein HYV35_10810 [Lentisphaerae bacterium]|nr:hypothetical protein [Lentisphaerota bacterium]